MAKPRYGGVPTQRRSRPSGSEPSPDLEAVLAYQAYVRRRVRELTRIVSKAAAGDYSEKPEIVESEDEVSQFVVGFRFLLEDLEFAKAEQEKRNRQIQEANARLQYQATLLTHQSEASPDGILVVDPKGRIASYNRQFVDMWLIPKAIVESGSDDAALQSVLGQLEAPDEFLARVRYLYAHPVEESHEEIRLKDGRTFDRHSAPLRSADDQYYGRVWYFRDITAIRRKEAELRSANDQLKELSALKTQFINTVAHELATPMTPLKLQLALLRAEKLGSLTPEQSRAIEMVDRNIDRLTRLVQDVLDVARLEARSLRLRFERVDLSRVVEQTCESFSALADKHGVALDWNAGTNAAVQADPARVEQVLFNLLSNAVKFTPSGGRINVWMDRTRQAAVVHVRDTGRGLEEKDFGRLFQPFSQVHDTMKSSHAGSGLGLYICQGIVQRHGGRIWCSSPGPNKGATFSFTIPLEPSGPEMESDRP